ncbi:MAG: pseudouridine synthase family protein [Myxococcota bacterium]
MVADTHTRADKGVQAALRRAGIETSLREIKRALRDGLITTREGRSLRPGDPLIEATALSVERFQPRSMAKPLADKELLGRVRIVTETPECVVFDKPSGIPTLPLKPGEIGCLLNAAVAYDPSIGEAGPGLDGGAVHRLDSGTSGLVVFARTRAAHDRWREAFRQHLVVKAYTAIVTGEEPPCHFTINAGIRTTGGRRVHLKETAKASGGARSEVYLRRWSKDRGIVEITTNHGQRHQVRVHLASRGLPILGDELYGGWPHPRMCLHASRIVYNGFHVESFHPFDNEA